MNDKVQNDKESGKFKVTDRRSFDSRGELRQDTPTRPESAEPESKHSQPGGQKEVSRFEEGSETQKGPQQEAEFTSFVMSLATTAMIHLGEIPDPVTQRKADNLDAAKQMIDILTMLKEKTTGNLNAEESHLLENLLYELRMQFLSKSKTIKL